MRRKIIFITIILLNGCYSDGCFYTPQSVSCVNKGNMWPGIAEFQNVNTIGHTDSQQRWKDAIDCGSKYGDKELLHINRQGKYNEFKICMEKKGYHRFWPAECGYQNPKWDTGKCNL